MSGKFRDKETGVEGYLRANRYMEYQIEDEKGVPINGSFKTLSELLEKWEEIEEEPKEHWAIDQFGEPINVSGLSRLQLEKLHRLGNDFPSENATMKAIEKLEAWKRLKDKGFRFDGRAKPNYRERFIIRCSLPKETLIIDVAKDLDILFGSIE